MTDKTEKTGTTCFRRIVQRNVLVVSSSDGKQNSLVDANTGESLGLALQPIYWADKHIVDFAKEYGNRFVLKMELIGKEGEEEKEEKEENNDHKNKLAIGSHEKRPLEDVCEEWELGVKRNKGGSYSLCNFNTGYIEIHVLAGRNSINDCLSEMLTKANTDLVRLRITPVVKEEREEEKDTKEPPQAERKRLSEVKDMRFFKAKNGTYWVKGVIQNEGGYSVKCNGFCREEGGYFLTNGTTAWFLLSTEVEEIT